MPAPHSETVASRYIAVVAQRNASLLRTGGVKYAPRNIRRANQFAGVWRSQNARGGPTRSVVCAFSSNAARGSFIGDDRSTKALRQASS
jgi:hypothetical protein